MCLAIPARVVAIDGVIATVELSGNTTRADISALPDTAMGDYLLVHAGFAIQKFSEKEAKITLDLLAEMADCLNETNV